MYHKIFRDDLIRKKSNNQLIFSVQFDNLRVPYLTLMYTHLRDFFFLWNLEFVFLNLYAIQIILWEDILRWLKDKFINLKNKILNSSNLLKKYKKIIFLINFINLIPLNISIILYILKKYIYFLKHNTTRARTVQKHHMSSNKIMAFWKYIITCKKL